MTRRSGNADGCALPHPLFDRRERDAGGRQDALPAARAEKCVGVERAATARVHRLEQIDISGRMHTLDRGTRRRRGFHPFHVLRQLGVSQRFEHGLEPLRALRVSRARVVVPAGRVPDDCGRHLVLAVGVQQLANRFHFALHLFTGGGQVRQGVPVALPPPDHEYRRDAADGGPEEAADEREQHRVEQQKPDGEDRDGPREGGSAHRTGWRRAGSTTKGAFGTAPTARSVSDSSSTAAPRNFTMYSCSPSGARFNAARNASRLSCATVVVSSTCTDTCSHAGVTMTRTAYRSATSALMPPRAATPGAASRETGPAPDRRTTSRRGRESRPALCPPRR